MKKVSKTPCNKDDLVPAKKAKLCITSTSEKFQKLRHNKNNKNNSLQTIVEAGTSSTTNKVTDNSSGSEYIPSDNEDFGNINI